MVEFNQDLEQVKARIAQFEHWYHRIELAPGIVTPGTHDSPLALRFLEDLGLPKYCEGKRVLDIGCRDGFFAFEMERRGAEVVGIDYALPEITGFSIAAKILGSKVVYKADNVYNLSIEEYGVFDIVLFLGVLYHLRNPMLAIDKIRSVMKPGGLLFVESQMAKMKKLLGMDVPVWQFNPRDEVFRHTNKWNPNLKGLELLIEECEFEIGKSMLTGDRGHVVARAVEDSTLEYYRNLDASIGMWGKDP